MQLRAYPISDFEQRQADTEELRQAMIYYRSLFDELLEVEPVAA